MTQISESGAFTVNEFLSWAKIGRTKFYQEVESGALTTRKLGRKTLILRSDAQAWLDSLPKAA